MVDNTSLHRFFMDLENEQASGRFASVLASCLASAAIITLSGEIGTGKTSIVRAALKHLGVKSTVKSPSFSLVETYHCNRESWAPDPLTKTKQVVHPQDLQIHHFDLYRVHHEDELEYIGFRDYFTEDSICFIEWPEHAGKLLPNIDMGLKLMMKREGRQIEIIASSVFGKELLSCLMRKY